MIIHPNFIFLHFYYHLYSFILINFYLAHGPIGPISFCLHYDITELSMPLFFPSNSFNQKFISLEKDYYTNIQLYFELLLFHISISYSYIFLISASFLSLSNISLSIFPRIVSLLGCNLSKSYLGNLFSCVASALQKCE